MSRGTNSRDEGLDQGLFWVGRMDMFCFLLFMR